MENDTIGLIVTSLAGRDKGRAFVVVGRADGEHLLIADGKLRTAAKPKKKKLKHLRFAQDRVDIGARLGNSGTADAFIRSSLMELGYTQSSIIKEG